jgi:hypothetical protein
VRSLSGEARITRAYDERTKTVTTPKTDMGRIRTVTIPATPLPLLERLARERGAEDRVCPFVAATPEKSRAGIYREHLQAADVDDATFYIETATHLPIDFRSLRDSGITWRFLASERAEVVQREAGHEHLATTLGYAKEVQNRGGRYGVPPSLHSPPSSSTERSPTRRRRVRLHRGEPVEVVQLLGHSKGEVLSLQTLHWSGRRDLKTSPEGAIACDVAGSALGGVSIEGVESAPNRAIVRTSDESQTLRHTVDRAVFDDCAMSDSRTRNTAHVLALIVAADALLDACSSRRRAPYSTHCGERLRSRNALRLA